LFICIDGLDAAGKATQTKLLAERIRAEGREVFTYSFPRYDTPVGAAIKRLLVGTTTLTRPLDEPSEDIALVLQALMLADKCDAIKEITERLMAGAVVICDRWIPSALCYGAADGLDVAWLASIHFPLLDADMNVFIDVSPEEALRRRPEARDRFERDREKQAAVRKQYTKLWQIEREGVSVRLPVFEMPEEAGSSTPVWWVRVNGERPAEEVTEGIFRYVVGHDMYGVEPEPDISPSGRAS
jgi:dTMP kinase